MSATYEPGAVAVATVRGATRLAPTRVYRIKGGRWRTLEWINGGDVHTDADVTDVRPLVVLDPEDREQVERLAKEHHAAGFIAKWEAMHGYTRAVMVADMQAALRSLTRPPKPAEPTDLGAQVRDCDGEMWVRNVQGAWINLHGRYGLDPAQTWDGLCEKYGPIEVAS